MLFHFRHKAFSADCCMIANFISGTKPSVDIHWIGIVLHSQVFNNNKYVSGTSSLMADSPRPSQPPSVSAATPSLHFSASAANCLINRLCLTTSSSLLCLCFILSQIWSCRLWVQQVQLLWMRAAAQAWMLLVHVLQRRMGFLALDMQLGPTAYLGSVLWRTLERRRYHFQVSVMPTVMQTKLIQRRVVTVHPCRRVWIQALWRARQHRSQSQWCFSVHVVT